MKNFFCPRSGIRFLPYFIFFVFILAPSLAGAAQVSLAWARSTGTNVAGYIMHYGNYSGNYQYSVNVGNSTSCSISGLNEGTTYYFAVTAYDTQQNESDFSNEVAHTINNPTPPVQDLLYTPVTPCRIVDTRKSGGMINAGTRRNFHVYGSGGTISAQGGTTAGCPAPLGEPLAVHINMAAVNPTGYGWLLAAPQGAAPTAGLMAIYEADTNVSNAGTVKTSFATGADIMVYSGVSSAHTAIDVLGYYYSKGDLLYTPVTPCRIVDTRKSGGQIGASTGRNFYVRGAAGTISAQGGNPAGCPAPFGEPLAVHINMAAVNPTGYGWLLASPKGAAPTAGLMAIYEADTNVANAGTVKTSYATGTDIRVYSGVSSAHTAIDVLGYYYSSGDLVYTPVTPCRIVDTRKSGGQIGASTGRNFYVRGAAGTISAQGGNPAGCPAPFGEPLAVHINMAAVNPTGYGWLLASPKGAAPTAGLMAIYEADTNVANAGTVKTSYATGTDIRVYSGVSSAHTAIDVLGYYYSAP